MSEILLDTNIVILHLSGKKFLSFPLHGSTISALSIFELLCLPGLSSEEERAINEIIKNCRVVPVTESIANRAALIARTVKKHPIDLLIAATAIECGLVLLTENIRDFRNIPGLKIQKT
ncbi:PIN domain-containing protein [Candidatus Uhrbacteria bacterium]|nr:PIN domain-containing protein [Candidatus Uhrbacteria bacterium]